MEYLAGVWEFVTFLATTRRGLSWLVIAAMVLSAIAVVAGALM